MATQGCTLVAAISLLQLLSTATDAHVPLQRSEPNRLSLKPEKAADSHPFLCASLGPSPSPPSSVHTIRPSDVALVSALGLSHSPQATGVFNRMAEILSIFNPHLATLLPNGPASKNRNLLQQAEDLVLSLGSREAVEGDRSWRLLLVFVSVDELHVCPGQEAAAVSSATKEVEDVLTTLESQLPRTLVRVVVWSEHSEVIHSCVSGGKRRSGRSTMDKAILTAALQESLSDLLANRRWFGERDDFSAVLLSSPLSTYHTTDHIADHSTDHSTDHTTDQPILQLWAEMLQPMKDQPAVDVDGITRIACPREETPYLRTQQNSHSKETDTGSTPQLDPVNGSELPCVNRTPSASPPSSVHALRPADIKVVAALGDSLTAANGAGSKPNNLLDVITEYRGLSWSIGGDSNLTSVTTIPNILREFNPSLVGFSVGKGSEDSPKAFLNQAVPGANAHDMPEQARVLIQKMKNDSRIDYQNDWKVITLFIGGNDLCDHCSDSVYFSAANIVGRIQETLDILHKEVPRALVNLVEVMYMVPLRELHLDSSVKCPTWVLNILCGCVVKPKEGTRELEKLVDTNRAYQRGTRELVDSGYYDTHDNFTVVLQPFFREVVLPLLEDGRPDRSFFSPDCFHLSQKAHSLMARALWNNMLEPVGNKTSTYDFSAGLSLQCPSESSPYLRTYRNSNHTYSGPVPTPPPVTNWGSDFSCEDTTPSPTIPTSVHRLRPGDIRVVASLGDSITAGFGAKARNLLQLTNEERGVSWCIGGDQSLDTVTTLPNILRQFNPNVYGFSKGRSKRPNGFNMAVSGAKAGGIPGQVRDLILAWKSDSKVDWANDWKLVTLLIGGNDLCQYCRDRDALSTQNYTRYLRESFDMLYNEVPRVLVNVAEVLEIEDLRKVKRETVGCQFLQPNLCPCFLKSGENSLELYEMKRINRDFQVETAALVNGGRYDGREDFAVVIQPFFQNSMLPINKLGLPDVDYFSVDCFHFSERGHADMALALWNNMLEPVGSKQNYNNFTHDRSKIQCPTKDHPFIFTRVNSAPVVPTTPPVLTTPHVHATPTPVKCSDTLPVWATAVLAVTGLVIGWAVTWTILSWRERKSRKKMPMSVEMKATTF
ncbi:phospholipase B1, membrane-associated isoform X1 [Clupea harengus]|uniref:Phospholipase B1, membrane-associated isoform X1 n=1 Tax=Clupea harengus TaxID=7950 RepID=A0A6P8GMD8_CLUHA|nr:phospholipase B1, membrane-associated isoform X1 [Clupea harengus]